MKNIYIFTSFIVITIAINSIKVLTFAATTSNPYLDPMTEDVFSDSTVKDPSSDPLNKDVTQLLEPSSTTGGSGSTDSSNLTTILNPTVTSTATEESNTGTSNTTGQLSPTATLNATGESSSTNTLNATGESSSTGTLNATGELNFTDIVNPTGESNSTGEFNAIGAFNPTETTFNLTQPEPVPEPLTIFGTGLALGFGALFNKEYSRRKKATKHRS